MGIFKQEYGNLILTAPKSALIIIIFLFAVNHQLFAGGNPPSCVSCCCGSPTEVGIPNGNFQDPPIPSPTIWIDFLAGQAYSNWTITSGTVSLHGPFHNNLGVGNPNGASQHMDLNGYTNGSISTPLTNLTPGNKYTIVLWYAKHNGTSTGTINMKIENGNWLDETWTVTNTGSSFWLEKCISFTAQDSSTILEFIGTSPSPCCGVLIDDLTMFCCSPDIEAPVFNQIPDPFINVECEKDVPILPNVTASDICDNAPVIKFTETILGDKCQQTITRTWLVEDKCMNTATIEQIVLIEDKETPFIIQPPIDKIINCDENIIVEFYNWINNNGGALATDNCSTVFWSADYLKEPTEPCEDVDVTFIANDSCGNKVSVAAKFKVIDTKAPLITTLPTNPYVSCSTAPYDSLLNWISRQGEANAMDNCGKIEWTNDFNGDLTKDNYTISFYATDDCGNESGITATFNIKKSNSINFLNKQTCDLTMAGIDTVVIQVGNCDSLIITNTTFIEPDTTFLSAFTCKQSQPTTDTIKLANLQGCDSLIITNYQYLAIQAESFVKNETCLGFGDGSIVIQNIQNGTPPFQYSFDNLTWTSNPVFNNLIPGTFNIYVKDSSECITELKGIFIKSGENFKISLGPDLTIKEGNEVTINLIYSILPASTIWQPSSLIDCGYCFSYAFTPTGDTEIYVNGESEAGCQSSDSLLIKIIPDIKLYIPNAFSPDLDGINDRWIIYGNYHVINIKELKIYDRWGEMVFTGSNIAPGDAINGWDGKFRDRFLNPAVFVFWAIIEYDNGQSELVKGEINLLR